MRNLWNFIVQYQVILVFMVLQALALSWFISSRGYPKGKWVRLALDWESAWQGQISEWSHRAELSDQNFQLLEENARLRSRMGQSSVSHFKNRSQFIAAEVIRATWTQNQNHFVLDQGENNGVQIGQGVIANGAAIGKIIETTQKYSIGIPLIHNQLDWSARIGNSGAIGRLKWEGGDRTTGMLFDIPRSAAFKPGDSVITTGFQGVFPPDILFGTVANEEPYFDGEFLNVPVQWAAEFQSLRYVHLTDTNDGADIDSLEGTFNHSVP
ncbi:MAG: rod shape-determining protein MreC [Crocinitomicaceae bacterium]|nr:rod shape-determining protein MreC [Crocinitomicaceae bacterium]